MSKCILICGGDLLNTGIKAEKEDLIIACDAGVLYCELLEIRPHMIIGDFDSLMPEDYERVKELYSDIPIVKLPVVKDDTDSLAAIRIGLEKGYKEFHLYAATGGLLDHTFANIQCLSFIKESGGKGYIWDQDGMITMITNESISFKEDMEGRVSVFAYGGDAIGVDIEGLYYEIKDETLSCTFPVGVSNSFNNKKSTVSVREGTLLIMVYWE